MSKLCVEWRAVNSDQWHYQTGTAGLSRGFLNRLISGWRQRNPDFKFRIYAFKSDGEMECCVCTEHNKQHSHEWKQCSGYAYGLQVSRQCQSCGEVE